MTRKQSSGDPVGSGDCHSKTRARWLGFVRFVREAKVPLAENQINPAFCNVA